MSAWSGENLPSLCHRKLYVVLSVVLCLLASSLVAFFLFPRPVVVVDGGIRSVTVRFDRNNTKVLMNMTVGFISQLLIICTNSMTKRNAQPLQTQVSLYYTDVFPYKCV